MTPGRLISAIAAALRIPNVTTGVYYRVLREAGLLSKSGRGKSAANVTISDASYLITAILASEGAKGSAEVAKIFGRLARNGRARENTFRNEADDDFVTTVKNLLTSLDDESANEISVQVAQRNKIAVICQGESSIVFSENPNLEEYVYYTGGIITNALQYPGLETVKSIKGSALLDIASHFRE